jgi:phage head maturation protease
MSKIRKTFDIELVKVGEDGGEITINTGAVDRDKDRVFPEGATVDNYLKNPVVQYGHNYREPWATVGKTNELTVGTDTINAAFQLRPAANEHDPQNIVKLLWSGGWIRTASIGFLPNWDDVEENEFGGYDFNEWELLEWSLVPVPANQEALRLAFKALQLGKRSAKRYVMGATNYWEISPDLVQELGVPYGEHDEMKRLYVVELPVETAERWGVSNQQDYDVLKVAAGAGEKLPEFSSGATGEAITTNTTNDFEMVISAGEADVPTSDNTGNTTQEPEAADNDANIEPTDERSGGLPVEVMHELLDTLKQISIPK